MKKGRIKNSRSQKAESGKEFVHFRLCHVCLHLNESSSDIVRCEVCRRYLSFESGWEQMEKPQAATASVDEEDELIAPSLRKRPLLLTGLSVLW